jgi:Ferroportin1 (FPN1)
MEAAGEDSSSGGQRVHSGNSTTATTETKAQPNTADNFATDTAAAIVTDTLLDVVLVNDKANDIASIEATTDTGTAITLSLQSAIDTILHGEDTTTNPHLTVADEVEVGKPPGAGLSADQAAAACEETDPLNPEGQRYNATEVVAADGDSSLERQNDGGNIYLLYLSRALTAWGDRLWAFGLGMFLFRIRPESLLLMAGYGLARSVSSILLGAALGAWIDRTGRLRLVFDGVHIRWRLSAHHRLKYGYIISMYGT